MESTVFVRMSKPIKKETKSNKIYVPMEIEPDWEELTLKAKSKKNKRVKKKTVVMKKEPKLYKARNKQIDVQSNIFDYKGMTSNTMRPVWERDELFDEYEENWKAFEYRYGKPAYLARLFFMGINDINDVLINLEKTMYEEEDYEQMKYEIIIKILYNIFFYGIDICNEHLI